jgi:hypothetical protein
MGASVFALRNATDLPDTESAIDSSRMLARPSSAGAGHPAGWWNPEETAWRPFVPIATHVPHAVGSPGLRLKGDDRVAIAYFATAQHLR